MLCYGNKYFVAEKVKTTTMFQITYSYDKQHDIMITMLSYASITQRLVLISTCKYSFV